MAVQTGQDSDRQSRSSQNERMRQERRIKDSSAESLNTAYYEKLEIAFAIIAMQNPKYIKRFKEDGIEFESPLSNKILLAIQQLAESGKAASGIDKEEIFEKLDPDEETAFRKQIANIQIGPDDEAFYEETKAAYLSGRYRDEKALVTNNIALAEKTGNSEEIERLAARLMELDAKINELTEEK